MVSISQLILGNTGCVSYIVNCEMKRECAIVDPFENFEEDIHEELKRLGFPVVKFVIDTHTHADRKSASGYFAGEFGVEGVGIYRLTFAVEFSRVHNLHVVNINADRELLLASRVIPHNLGITKIM